MKDRRDPAFIVPLEEQDGLVQIVDGFRCAAAPYGVVAESENGSADDE
jgi:hypothetical protein